MAVALLYLNLMFASYAYSRYEYASLILIGGVLLTRELTLVVSRELGGRDKQYFMVKAVLDAKERDHAFIKSKILTEIMLPNQGLESKSAEVVH